MGKGAFLLHCLILQKKGPSFVGAQNVGSINIRKNNPPDIQILKIRKTNIEHRNALECLSGVTFNIALIAFRHMMIGLPF